MNTTGSTIITLARITSYNVCYTKLLRTSLGTLYFKVPGWPIGFGDTEKAEELLKHALEINPDGIDPNFFYGEFLLEEDRYAESVAVLSHALQAAPRPDRPLADAGRKAEIQDTLDKVRKHLE